MASTKDLRRELEELKSELNVSSEDGYTKKEKKYYSTHPIEFAEKEIFFKGRPIRLSDDQEHFLLCLATYDPYEAMFSYEYENPTRQEYHYSIGVASRNGGKTFILAIYALWRAVFFNNLWIRELGGSMHQARIFYHNYVKKFIEANPKLMGEVKGKIQAERTQFRSGTMLEMGACSETSTRGPHPDILLLDEVAAADKARKTDVIEAALDSAMGQICMMSTAHHVSGLFIRYLLKHEEYGYKVFEWPVCDLDMDRNIVHIRAPWIPKWRIEHAMATKSEEDFAVEWLAQTAASSATVFRHKDIDDSIVQMEISVILTELENQELGELANIPENLRKFFEDDFDEEDKLYSLTGTFGGCDIGYVHPQAIVILKKDLNDTFWIIHMEHYRGRSANWRAERVAELQELYDIDLFCLDAEDISFAQMCMGYGASIKRVPFQSYKSSLIGALKNLFEKKLIKIPSIYKDLLDQLYQYTYDDREKPIKGNDDILDALLFALYFWSLEAGDSSEILEIDVDLW